VSFVTEIDAETLLQMFCTPPLERPVRGGRAGVYNWKIDRVHRLRPTRLQQDLEPFAQMMTLFFSGTHQTSVTSTLCADLQKAELSRIERGEIIALKSSVFLHSPFVPHTMTRS